MVVFSTIKKQTQAKETEKGNGITDDICTVNAALGRAVKKVVRDVILDRILQSAVLIIFNHVYRDSRTCSS